MSLLRSAATWAWCAVRHGHSWQFDRNIYGDEINAVSGDRSWWRCDKCGSFRTRSRLIS